MPMRGARLQEKVGRAHVREQHEDGEPSELLSELVDAHEEPRPINVTRRTRRSELTIEAPPRGERVKARQTKPIVVGSFTTLMGGDARDVADGANLLESRCGGWIVFANT